ncbi:thioredoxin domain-containing protein [Acetobacteraceae bacterium ESL0709]|nr:thioredoxin domain-containing protein [Acetobacteraceae bacterium ESL0697]MDF7678437.1 thioredoxin domain-containing protein [Acetobacteraceae bacterium ESL0709]
MSKPVKPCSLLWGKGPVKLDVFIEPTCPFCVKTLNKLMPLLALVGESRMTLEIHLHSQPWHIFSPVVVRAVLAAASLQGGKEQAWRVLKAVADHYEEFEPTDHASGPDMDVTPRQILQRVEDYSGVDVKKEFESDEVTQAIKRHARFSRQNGVHVSPTFMVNGLIDGRFSSGEEIEKWAERLV